jgi:hypothetical protein
VVADLSGRILILDGDSGRVLRRLMRTSPAAALAVAGGRAVVADRAGIVAAY